MRKVCSFTAALGLLLLAAGCGGFTLIEGQKFSDPVEALAFLQSLNEQKLGQVEPLPDPIAGRAFITIWEQGTYEDMTRVDYPYMNAVEVSQHARILEERAMLLPRMIERRGIFQVIEILRADNPSSALFPADGYLIVYEFAVIESRGHDRIKIGAAGEPVLQALLLKRPPTSEGDLRLLFLEAIETYVETHPPSSVLGPSAE